MGREKGSKIYDPLVDSNRWKVEMGVKRWVKYLQEEGLINGVPSCIDQLIDFIVEELKPEDELWMPLYDRITIPPEGFKMERIDRKFKFTAVSEKSGKKYTQANAVVFLVKDALLPDLLDDYIALCIAKGVSSAQSRGVALLKDRVLSWQRKNIKKVKLPGVETEKEEKYICKPNR